MYNHELDSNDSVSCQIKCNWEGLDSSSTLNTQNKPSMLSSLD